MLEFYERWHGIIPFLGGIYLSLLAYRVLPLKLTDPKKEELWHSKFGKLAKALGPILTIFGLLYLLGILS